MTLVKLGFLMVLSGLAPFGLGVLLARSSGYALKTPVLILGTTAIAALTLAGLASRALYAPGEGRWPLPEEGPCKSWRLLAYISLALAGAVGVLLQTVWCTGDLTIPLGVLGILGGYFSFAPPLAWQRRGLGEAFGSLCFGLGAVFAGYYLQSSNLVTEILVLGVPLTLAAFNFFFMLGFPPAGQKSWSRPFGLAERLGPVGAALLYTVINILTVVCLVFCLLFPASRLWPHHLLWSLILLALVGQEMVKRRAYYHEARLRQLCWLSLALWWGMNLVFALILGVRL
jgi:1,4-dihydroxy-2-naphthoate octaprenyltransferase